MYEVMKVMQYQPINRKRLKTVLALLTLIFAGPLSAAIQGERPVAVPLVISIEDQSIRTSACIPVIEKTYGSNKRPGWVEFKKSASHTPETALVRTIDAIKSKNKSAFIKITHEELGRDPVKMTQQMGAYMQQFEVVQIGDVKGYLKFDNFLVFWVAVNFQGRSTFVDFAYALDDKGEYRFLPYRTSDLGFRAIMNWGRSKWGSTNETATGYCTQSELLDTTYAVPFDKADKYNMLAPKLMIRGASLASDSYQGINKHFDSLMASLRAEDYKAYVAGMTQGGRQRIGDWLASASKEERQKYTDSILEQKPFFILDADPFYVVYVKTQSHGVQSFYMARDGGGFKWANASYATPMDRIFKQEMVVRSASQQQPFQEWKK